MEIEQAYWQACDTFVAVVKIWINKDPSLEKPIQFTLRQNLCERGERYVEELKHFIAEYVTSSHDFGGTRTAATKPGSNTALSLCPPTCFALPILFGSKFNMATLKD